ncbi:MAG TPA: HEAT repeat domain-containing protein [Pyrinomonadaceae bacterium]|nr:HEAT repeat domain-containing protein [Pyrinomonadaceae bacterium]
MDVEERREAVERLGAMKHAEASRAAASALGDRAVIVRATAARSILSLGPRDVATLLAPLLRDRDEFVRREAAYALGTSRNRESVAALVQLLERDREASVRGAAAVALGQIGDPTAAAPLAASLSRRVRASGIIARITRSRRDEDPFVRRSAAVALGLLGSREGVPALVDVLSNERAEDDLRREAAVALGLIGDPTAIPTLRAALAARDPHLSRAAYEALRRIEPASASRPS